MSFVFLKFLHVAFMFLGTALAVGPATLLYLLARSGDIAAIRRAFVQAGRIFQVSTASYGLGIVFGFAAALAGTLELTASWLLIAYVLVALLGAHGILFDRWTKQVAGSFAATGSADVKRIGGDRGPTYLLGAMAVLVVAIVYVMVTKPSLF